MRVERTARNPRDDHLGGISGDGDVDLLGSVRQLAAVDVADRDHGAQRVRREALQHEDALLLHELHDLGSRILALRCIDSTARESE